MLRCFFKILLKVSYVLPFDLVTIFNVVNLGHEAFLMTKAALFLVTSMRK
jgi:hypothetical protein